MEQKEYSFNKYYYNSIYRLHVRFKGIIRTQFTKTLLEWINEIRKVIEQNINEKYKLYFYVLATNN